MHVYLTGAAGFIGSHVAEALVAQGHHVTGVDSFDGFLYPAQRKRENAHALTALPATRFRLHEGSILDADLVARTFTPDVDVMCHLAALAGVRPSLSDPTRYLRTNVEGTAVLLERARAVGCQRMVFASSSSVYGARDSLGEGFRETDACVTPASPYAASKRMGELLLSAYRDLYGVGSHMLRFFTVYGPRQRPDMAIAKFIDRIVADEPITLFGDGQSRRDYTFISDIVAGVVASITRVAPGDYEPLNLGGHATISLRDLVTVIEHTLDRKARIDWQPFQPGDVPITFANVDRAAHVLGYAPTTTVADGLAAYWRWHAQRRAS